MPNFMNIDAARLEAAIATSDDTSAPKTPDTQTVDEFQRSMEKSETIARDPDLDMDDTGRPPQLPITPLETMFAGRMPTTATPPSRPEAPVPTGELAEKLLERILVGRDSGGDQEVRLYPSADILPGTEIRLRKGNDGLLHVSLLTDDPASFQTLVAAQDSLKTRLEELGGHVRVHVATESRGEDNDSNRRSRGYVPENEESR